jgi:hypothetical protein
MASSQTGVLNWHLFKSGLRMEPLAEQLMSTP